MNALRNVLFATDGTDASSAAGSLAARLARDWGAKLTVVHAYDVPPMAYVGVPMFTPEAPGAIRLAARERLDLAVATVRETMRAFSCGAHRSERASPWRWRGAAEVRRSSSSRRTPRSRAWRPASRRSCPWGS